MQSILTTFARKRILEKGITGVIIKRSKKLTLFAKWDDFQFDGFVIIRNGDITKESISESNRYCTKIMKKESRWVKKLPRGLKDIDLKDWSTALNGIKSDVVIIENERKGDFIIGPILKTSKTGVLIHYFNSVGEWGNEELVKYPSITACQFMDRYSAIHAKYLKWGN